MPKKNSGLKKISWMLMSLLLFAFGSIAQKTVTGRVINKSNQQPIPNASVFVRGTQVATQTDSSGDFRIQVLKNNAVLEISSVGFSNIQISVGEKNDVGDIQLVISN